MTPTAQAIVVALCVVVAATYAMSKMMPAAWRRRFASSAAATVARLGARDDVVRRVEAKLSSGGACGSCESCRACATPASVDPGANDVVGNDARPLRTIPIRRAS